MEPEASTEIETIPVIHSILAADALPGLVARVYPLDPPMSCSWLRHSWNDTYQLATSNTRYVVRVYGVAQHTLPEILYELDLLQHLAQYNAPSRHRFYAWMARPSPGCTRPRGHAIWCCFRVRLATYRRSRSATRSKVVISGVRLRQFMTQLIVFEALHSCSLRSGDTARSPNRDAASLSRASPGRLALSS